MGIAGVVLAGVGALIVFTNLVTMRRLWASPTFETSQKIAQTALMWLIPGSVIVVWNVLREARIGDRGDTAAGGAAVSFADWALLSVSHSTQGGDGSHHGGSDHSGSDGGNHGGHDGNGGHHGGGGFGGDGGAGGSF